MKKLILLITVCLTSVSFSQSKLNGIGIFKLGMNEDILISKLDSLGYSGKVCNEEFTYKCRPSGLNYTKIPNILDNASTYFIGEYNVAGEKLTGIEINFFNKKLYDFSITKGYLGDLIDKLELKYGKFPLEKEEETTTCYFNGNSYKLPKTTFSKSYTNGDIKMTYLLVSTRDSKCDKNTYQIFGLYNSEVFKKVSELESKANKEKKQKENEEKRKKLTDL